MICTRKSAVVMGTKTAPTHPLSSACARTQGRICLCEVIFRNNAKLAEYRVPRATCCTDGSINGVGCAAVCCFKHRGETIVSTIRTPKRFFCLHICNVFQRYFRKFTLFTLVFDVSVSAEGYFRAPTRSAQPRSVRTVAPGSKCLLTGQ
jgi:hypothetical protein